jgi:hypothetical protein
LEPQSLQYLEVVLLQMIVKTLDFLLKRFLSMFIPYCWFLDSVKLHLIM